MFDRTREELGLDAIDAAIKAGIKVPGRRFPMFRRDIACPWNGLGAIVCRGYHGGAFSQSYRTIAVVDGVAYSEACAPDGTAI